MSEEYPLYPTLSESGQEDAQKLIDSFKDQMKKVASVALDELYCDVMPHVESDSWTNFRNDMTKGFCNYYTTRKIHGDYDYKKLREVMFKEFRTEIIADLNQDLLDENKSLKETITRLQDLRRNY